MVAGGTEDTSIALYVSDKDDQPNKLYLYGEIGWEISANEVSQKLDEFSDRDLVIHINSIGGSVFEGFAIYERLNDYEGNTESRVEGMAASIASLIMLGADEVKAYPTSQIMIHDPSVYGGGTAKDLRKQAELLDQIKDTLVNEYNARVSLSEKEIRKAMEDETWYKAEDALDIGLIDEIINKKKDGEKSVTKTVVRGQGEDPSTNDDPPNDPTATGDVDPTATGDTPPEPNNNPSLEPNNVIDMAQLTQQNKQRVADIRAAFEPHGEDYSDLMQECLDNLSTTADQAKIKLIDKMKERNAPDAEDIQRGRVETSPWIGGGFVAEAMNAVLARAGHPQDDLDTDVMGRIVGSEVHTMSLFELAKACIRRRGKVISGGRLEIVNEAMLHGSDDFNQILEDSARKSMLKAYQTLSAHHNTLCRIQPLSDFKVNKLLGVSEFDKLELIEPQGEYRMGTFKEFGEEILLRTYGKRFGISREAIINDDMSVFTTVPSRMGRAAGRMLGDMLVDLLTDTTLRLKRDNKTLFHADHNNTGSAVISSESLGAAEVAMTTHKEENDVIVELEPKYLYVPRTLRRRANAVTKSSYQVGANLVVDSTIPNDVPDLTIIPDARLDGKDKAAWYVLADPNTYDTLAMGFLDGNQTPYMESYVPFSTDGLQYKIRLDAGAAILESKGIYRGNNT